MPTSENESELTPTWVFVGVGVFKNQAKSEICEELDI